MMRSALNFVVDPETEARRVDIDDLDRYGGLQFLQHPREMAHQDLQAALGNALLQAVASPGEDLDGQQDVGLVGMTVAGDVAIRQRVLGRALDLAAGVTAGGGAVDQQRQQDGFKSF